ncbi:MAG: DNA helicase Rep [Gammaproteobacteria bacterium]|nr:DNA helicase Rep [Gammaproteobacteria bacterium]
MSAIPQITSKTTNSGLSSLNPRQRDAVRHVDGPLLVLAGAGSGKTRVITEKIAHLIRQCGYRPDQIAAVTFTNKAAREMKARAQALLGADKAEGLAVSTFHTLGLRILQQEHHALGYKKRFSIFDADDSRNLVVDILKAERLDTQDFVDQMIGQISSWKSDSVSPEQALLEAVDQKDAQAARVYASYQRSLRAYNAFDFDDMIARPVELLANNPEIRERWQNRFRYLLVDEYQDTNDAQYQLLKQLSGMRQAFTVVGDDDQSIYAWRGARPENLERLKDDYPKLEIVKLEQNYRSTSRILRVANHIIANNPHVFEKRLWSEMGEGDAIRVIGCKESQHEVERVVTDLVHRKVQRAYSYKHFAILYRSNHQSRLFERALREQGVPYHLSGGMSFFDRGEVRDVLAYLRLLVNLDDDQAFLRIVNVPRRAIGAATLEKLSEYASRRETSLFSACFEMGLAGSLNARQLESVQEFARWVSWWSEQMEEKASVSRIEELLEDINYLGWLEDSLRDPDKAKQRYENIEELLSWMGNIIKRNEGDISLADLMNRMALIDRLDRNGDDDPGDVVQLMTLHAAKGLEFPHVYLVGCEEDLLPHRNSIEADTIEEERRLMYVGITRAQRTLCISYANQRRRFGEDYDCEPSRFLEELPQDDLEWEGGGVEKSREEQVEAGRSTLAGLRGLLAD